MFGFSPCYAVGLEPGQVFFCAAIQHRSLGCVFLAANVCSLTFHCFSLTTLTVLLASEITLGSQGDHGGSL